MHKTILIILITVVSSSAMAKWTFVLKSSDGLTSYYIDYSSIRKSSNKAKMRILVDQNQAIKINARKEVFSYKGQYEYKCHEKHERLINKIIYSENMGEGNIIDSFDVPEKWTPIVPGSASEVLLMTACRELDLMKLD